MSTNFLAEMYNSSPKALVKIRITTKAGKLLADLTPDQFIKFYGIPKASMKKSLSHLCKLKSEQDMERDYQVVAISKE